MYYSSLYQITLSDTYTLVNSAVTALQPGRTPKYWKGSWPMEKSDVREENRWNITSLSLVLILLPPELLQKRKDWEKSTLVHYTTRDHHFHNLIHSVWSSEHHLWCGLSRKTPAIQKMASLNPFSFPKSCCGFQKRHRSVTLIVPLSVVSIQRTWEKR